MELRYEEILRLTGNGAKTSDQFQLMGNGAALAFNFADSSGFDAAIMQVYLHDAAGNMVDVVVNEGGAKGRDQTRIYKKGIFFLKVNAANCNWSIVVSDTREYDAEAERKEKQRQAEIEEQQRQQQAVEVERQRALAETQRQEEYEASFRTWTDASGKFSIDARYVKNIMGTITLEKRDGTTVDLTLEKLSEADREFIKNRKAAK